MRKLLFIVCVLIFTSCESNTTPVPKPRAYPKVIYPERAYQLFDKAYCNLTFEYPVYAEIQQDTSFFRDKPENPCWFNIYIPKFNCYVYCSYSGIDNSKKFEKLTNDAFTMAYKHDQRANYIDDKRYTTKNGLGGIQFEFSGPAASPLQFFITDSTSNFIRGSLYFNTQVRPDSLLPVYKFVKEDVLHMISTLKFNSN